MDEDWIYPYILGCGFASTITAVPQDLPKEKVKQKQRIGFHTPHEHKRRSKRSV